MKEDLNHEYPRILVISNNPFSNTSNNGKTLASFFKSFPSENIAQLYFNVELPSCNYYNNYFRITDNEMVKNLLKKEEPGEIVLCSNENYEDIKQSYKHSLISKAKKYNITRIIREYFWMDKRWNTDKLDLWLNDFNAEIIFLCAGDSGFAYDIAEYIKSKLETKLIVYITDDYILPRKTLSPLWWIRRNYIYNKMRKSVCKSNLFITISEEMRKTYKELFGKDSILAMNIIESMNAKNDRSITKEKDKIILVYAGGLHFKRYKTLNLLAKAIKQYNLKSKGKKAFLEIYSGSEPNKAVKKQLNIEGASEYCGSLSHEEVKITLNNCDITVHVESFDTKSMESTRLSISTKISEYLSLGKPILAIGPDSVASMKYLEDCAVCINNKETIDTELVKLLNDDKLFKNLIDKACAKYKKNHIETMVAAEFTSNILKVFKNN